MELRSLSIPVNFISTSFREVRTDFPLAMLAPLVVPRESSDEVLSSSLSESESLDSEERSNLKLLAFGLGAEALV